MPISEATKRAVRKYDERMTRQFNLKLNIKTDADVIKKLDSIANKQGYIKRLIRMDMIAEANEKL